MAQTYIANNPGAIGIGRQTDTAIAFQTGTTPEASASFFVSNEELTIADEPTVVNVTDSTGTIGTNQLTLADMRAFPLTYSMALALDNILPFLYAHSGIVSSVQDGATGAYTHTFTFLNNIVKPPFTVFQNDNARGHLRYSSGHIGSMNIEISDGGGKISGDGLLMVKDTKVNSTANVTGFTVTDATYVSGNFNEGGSVVDYVLGGAPDLSAIVPGDVLVIPAAATGFANDEHKGYHNIVAVNDGTDTVTVLNNRIYDNTKDESTLVTAGTFSIERKVTSTYIAPTEVMLLRHSSIKVADDVSGLATATPFKAWSFNIETNHNGEGIPELPASEYFLVGGGKNLTATGSASMLLKGSTATIMDEILDRQDTAGNNRPDTRAWQFILEDTSRFLGTSTTLHPKLQITIPKAYAIGTVTGGNDDYRMIEWDFNVSEELGMEIVVQCETPTPIV